MRFAAIPSDPKRPPLPLAHLAQMRLANDYALCLRKSLSLHLLQLPAPPNLEIFYQFLSKFAASFGNCQQSVVLSLSLSVSASFEV